MFKMQSQTNVYKLPENFWLPTHSQVRDLNFWFPTKDVKNSQGLTKKTQVS
jgi:hypothetical protein